jgi:tetratricopeptide (TPR) repeat protein
MSKEPSTEHESPEEAEAPLPIMPAAGQVALSLGIQAAGADPDVARRTAELLTKQSHMLDVQMEHLHEQRLLQMSHLRMRRWEEWSHLILRGLGACLGVAIAVAVVIAVWQARQDNSVVITPFSAPPDLAAAGLSGEVLAGHLLDHLAELQEHTDSARAPDTFRHAGGEDIKVEIPETGISIGEFLKLLRGWLGHETRITGDVAHTPGGLTVTSRVGEAPGRSFTGPPANVDDLMQKAAEAVYAQTQPYRYGVYLARTGRSAEALQVYQALARDGEPGERAWAYIGWGSFAPDMRARPALLRRGLALNPRLAPGWIVLAEQESMLGHDQAALQALQKADRLLSESGAGGTSPKAAAQNRLAVKARTAEHAADYAQAARNWAEAAGEPGQHSIGAEAGAREAIDRALNHDISALDDPAHWKDAGSTTFGPLLRANAEIARAIASDDWSRTAAALESIEHEAQGLGPDAYRPIFWMTQVHPGRADALARTGRLAEAQALADATPVDCYPCLRARGLIAMAAGDRQGAAAWLEKATSAAPSLPFGWLDRARLALAAADAPKALDLATHARRLGPQWADAAAVQAEAFRRLGRCGEAGKAIADAERLAPLWPQARPAKLACSKG